MGVEEAYALASEIEWITAKRLAERHLTGGRSKAAFRQRAEAEYDPLAATALGDLIYARANKHALSRKDPSQ